MTEADLRELIEGGETFTVEFKSDSPDQKRGLSDDDLIEALVCLANGKGGHLLLGLEDDGTITGLHPARKGARPEALAAFVSNKTVPYVNAEVQFVEIDGKVVASIFIPTMNQLVATTGGKMPARRMDSNNRPECRPLLPQDIPARLAVLGNFDYSERTLPALTFEDLSAAELSRFRQFIAAQPQAEKSLLELDDLELAKALGLVKRVQGIWVPTVAGVLLAGDQGLIQEHIPGHGVALQELKVGQDVKSNNFYSDPLLRVWERFEDFFTARNSEEEITLGLGMQRTAIPDFPVRAVREAFANALVHRDYTLRNAIYVQLHQDDQRLVINSPGGFVSGITTQNILSSEPKPRNWLLADIFKRLGLVERTGRGVPRIFEDVLSLGRPAPSYQGTSSSSVRLTIPGGTFDKEFIVMVLKAQNAHQKVDWRQLLTLHSLRDQGGMSTHEISEVLDGSEKEARRILEELVGWGLVEAKSTGAHRKYHLSSSLYRKEQKAAATRQRGPDPVRQQQSVLQYLREHGQIQRADVVRLLPEFTPRQANYLLDKMLKEGQIERHGHGKAIHYTLTSAEPG